MKAIIVILALLIAVPCFAGEQVWVDAKKVLAEKEASAGIEVTQKMKDDIVKLDEITVQKVKAIVQGSSSDAKKVIEELVDEKKIVTKQDRYSELYPSAELEP